LGKAPALRRSGTVCFRSERRFLPTARGRGRRPGGVRRGLLLALVKAGRGTLHCPARRFSGGAPPPACERRHRLMAELTALFLGGLAFFFLGVDGVRTHLRRMVSRRVRWVMAHLTGRAYLAGAWGLLFGAITQSPTAVSFIVVGMTASGLLTRQRALLMVATSNLGTVALVFLAALDLTTAIYYLIGVTGLLLAFQVVEHLEVSLRVFFIIRLLLLGLHLMKQATGPLPQYAWFGALVSVAQGSVFAGFLLGTFLRVVI